MKSYKNRTFQKILKNYYNSVISLKKFGIGYKTTCDIGEFFAKEICGVRLINDRNNPNIDGIDKNGQRVQIKTRHRHKDNPNVYVFRPFKKEVLGIIDYALLIILDEKFWIDEIWKVGREVLKNKFKNTKSDSFNLTSGVKRLKGVKQLYP